MILGLLRRQFAAERRKIPAKQRKPPTRPDLAKPRERRAQPRSPQICSLICGVVEDMCHRSDRLYPLCFHSVSTFRMNAPKSGYKAETKWRHVSALSPLHEDSRILLEVLRLGLGELGSTGPRTSTRTFPRPGSIQEPEHPAPNGAPPANHQSPPLASSRSTGRPSRSAITENMAAADSPRPKPPGLGDGVLLWTSSQNWKDRAMKHRTTTG